MTTASPAPKKSSMIRSINNVIIVWILLSLVGLVAFFMEGIWFLFVMWLPIYLMFRWKWWIGLFILPLSVVVITLHVNGYKLYGREYLINNRQPSADASVDVSVVAFGPDVSITLADGRSFRLAGLRVHPDLREQWNVNVKNTDEKSTQASTDSNPTSTPWTRLIPLMHYRGLVIEGASMPTHLHIINEQLTQATVLWRYKPQMGCFPSNDEEFFPRRVPLYTEVDLGRMLLKADPRLETDDTPQGLAYKEWLIKEHPKRGK